jgi:hypothetical protein
MSPIADIGIPPLLLLAATRAVVLFDIRDITGVALPIGCVEQAHKHGARLCLCLLSDKDEVGRRAAIRGDVPGRFRQCFGFGLCLSQIMAEGGRGAAIRCDVSARHRQCFSFCLCLCLCPGLCLSQIMTSPVRPQLGGLVIPCFGLCLCCLCQPTASRTRVALLLRSATMRRKYGCGFACAVSSRRNPNQLGAGEGSHPFLGVCRNLQAGRRS